MGKPPPTLHDPCPGRETRCLGSRPLAPQPYRENDKGGGSPNECTMLPGRETTPISIWETTMERRVLVVPVLVMVLTFAWYAKRSLDRRHNWEEVRKAATRVESGIRHETLIALRSKVADLDAAVNNFARLEGSDDGRVAAIHNAVDALEWAIAMRSLVPFKTEAMASNSIPLGLILVWSRNAQNIRASFMSVVQNWRMHVCNS